MRAIPRVRKIPSKLLRIEIENYSHHHDNGNVSNRTSMDTGLFNRIPAMAVYIRPLFGVLFLRGHFSLKNRS
jgi:hypothetical protein